PVELDLVQPFLARRRRRLQGGEGRRDEAGERGLLRLFRNRQARRFRAFDLPRLRRPPRRLTLHLLDRPAGLHRLWPLFQDVRIIFTPREFVVALDEEPIVLLLARLSRHAHEMPASAQLLPVDLEIEMPLAISLLRVSDRRPSTSIPEDDGPAAVLSLRDRSFEVAIFERMILDMNGESLLAGHEARPLRDSPALQNAVHLQTKIVVQPPGGVFLYQVAVALGGPFYLSGRLRRRVEITLLAVLGERHQLALRRSAGAAFFRERAFDFFGVLPDAFALSRRASRRLVTLVSLGGGGALISRPSILAFTSSARASS